MYKKYLKYLLVILISLIHLNCEGDFDFELNNLVDPYNEKYIPLPPSSLQLFAVADTGVILTWKPESTAEEGFRIYRKNGFNENFKQIAEVPPKTSKYFDSFPVITGETYFYYVASFNKNIKRNYSEYKSVLLDYIERPVVKLTLIESRSIFLQFTYNDSTFSTGLVIERSANSAPYIKIASLPLEEKTYSDSSIEPGNIYKYRAKVVSRNNSSGYSFSTEVFVP